jgi:hypothetical protein
MSPGGKERYTQKIMDDIRKEKREGVPFLMMVPEKLMAGDKEIFPRAIVLNMAREHFDQKGGQRTMYRFLEDMALNWLAKKKVFEEMADMLQLESSKKLERDANTPALLFSVNGSVMLFGAPIEGLREYYYLRIHERDDVRIKGKGLATIKEDVALGHSCRTTAFSSSSILDIKTAKSRELNVQQAAAAMSESFLSIDAKTIH